MKVTATALPGVLLIEPRVIADERGLFAEAWHGPRHAAAASLGSCVQLNWSRSRRGVLRGLHFQQPRAQGKLVWVLQGEIFDVAVDVRRGSPTFGRWVSALLSAENRRQLFVPPGLAHGFYTLSERAEIVYLCSEVYDPEGDRGVRWDDPDLAIAWPEGERVLSPKDAVLPLLADAELPMWAPSRRDQPSP